MKPYILVVWNDIEPEISGPFSSEESRLEFARSIRRKDADKDHGIYRLEAEGNVEVKCFTGGDLDIEEVTGAIEFSSEGESYAISRPNLRQNDEVYWQDPAGETSEYGIVVGADDSEILYLKLNSGSEVEAFRHECLQPGPDDTESRGTEELRKKYGHWGEHPDHFIADWIYEVRNGDTRLGYWEWVSALEYDG